MRKKLIIIAGTVLVIGLILYVLFFHRKNVSNAIQTTGIVEGIEVNLSPKVPGKIMYICCREGDEVNKGDAVIRLESEDLKAALEEAMAGVDMAKADIAATKSQVESAKAGVKNVEGEISAAEADVNKARVQMEKAKREMDRSTRLHKTGVISQEEFDLAKSDYESSVADFEASKSRLSSIYSQRDSADAQWDSAKNQLKLKEAHLKQAEKAVLFAQAKLDDMLIKAPISGTIVYKELEVGETVSFGETILTLVDMNSLYARVDIEESRIGDIKLHGTAVVNAPYQPERSFNGKIVEIGRYADFATQRDVVRGRQDIKTFRVKIELENSQGFLKPGMTVDVTIPRS